MGKIRPSRYLNQVEVGDGTSLLFNGATMCIDLVPTDYAHLLTANTTRQDLAFLSAEEKEYLLHRGHLTALTPRRELEEFKKLVRFVLDKRVELNAKARKAIVSFILSYNCNLSCSYCYQKSVAHKSRIPGMSEEFLDEFFSVYLPQMFPDVPQKNFRFVLFGGEPLLPSNRRAIAKILDFTKKHSIRVSTATNGLTLGAMTEFIGPGKGKIQNVQVTLDGDRLFHDEQRVGSAGKPTFDDMIAAVRQLMGLKAKVFLRIHTHPGRLKSAKRLAEYLDAEKILGRPRVEVYFAPLNSFSMEKCSPADLDIFCDIFQKVALKTKMPPSLNLDFMDFILKMQTIEFLPKERFCSLGTDNHRLVDPLGDIYECYEEAGHQERRIGRISEGKLCYFPLKETNSRRHLLNIPECLECRVALFCGGGCPNQARIQMGSIFKPHCLQTPEFIAQTLKAYFLIHKSSGDKKPGAPARRRQQERPPLPV